MASGYITLLTKEWKPKFRTFFTDLRARRDKDYFAPSGVQVYCGRQGSGKTVSAVKHADKIYRRWPKCILITNIHLNYYNERSFTTQKELDEILADFKPDTDYIFFTDVEQLHLLLVGVNNGFYGVLYSLDELHLYFNSVAEGGSKNVPMYVFTEISQQRKQRKCIVGTSQIFNRLSKPFREQCDNVIMCSTMFGVLTIQRAFDGMDLDTDYNGKNSGSIARTGWFYHDKYIREAYDTYQKVVSANEQYSDIQRPDDNIKQLTRAMRGR